MTKQEARKEYRRITAFRKAEKRRKAIARAIDLAWLVLVCTAMPLFLMFMLCFAPSTMR